MNIKNNIRDSIPGEMIDKARTIYHWKQSRMIKQEFDTYLKSDLRKYRKENLKENVLKYVERMHIDGPYYKFSAKTDIPTLYASVFACLIKGSFGEISEKEKREWKDYFDSFQRADGLYVDNEIKDDSFINRTRGYGARHLIGHITIAYDRIGALPQKEFDYLKTCITPDEIKKWLDTLDYKWIWASSNEIMNYGIAMQYSRDRFNIKYLDAIEYFETELIRRMRSDCGMWFEGKLNSKFAICEAIRGAYHVIPILYYDHVDIPFKPNALRYLIESQNCYGGFDALIGSGACEDIDAMDPLLRYSILEKKERNKVLKIIDKAEEWILFNQNEDGGFCYDVKKCFVWGNQQSLFSDKRQSNMFATWFRLLSLQMMEEYRAEKNIYRIVTPGMECPLYI